MTRSEEFVEHVRTMVDYWDGSLPGGNVPPSKSQRDRLSGLAFSILVALDGGAACEPPAEERAEALHEMLYHHGSWKDRP